MDGFYFDGVIDNAVLSFAVSLDRLRTGECILNNYVI